MAPLGLKAIVGESKIFFVYYFIWIICVFKNKTKRDDTSLTSGIKLRANVKCDTGEVKLPQLKSYSLSATLPRRLVWRKYSLAHSGNFILFIIYFIYFWKVRCGKGAQIRPALPGNQFVSRLWSVG